jgi:hypothetical protein
MIIYTYVVPCKRLYLCVSSKYVVVKCGQTHGWIIYIMEDEKSHLNGYAWFGICGTFCLLVSCCTKKVFRYNGDQFLNTNRKYARTNILAIRATLPRDE